MSNNDVLGRPSRDTAEWNSAWEVVRRLAAARRTALHGLKESAPSDGRAGGADMASAPVLPDYVPSAGSDPSQYARAIAEIEQASAALRRAEPALEAWMPETSAPPDGLVQSEPRHPRSVWFLVGGIWISTVLVVASAIGATLFLLG